VLQRVFLLAGLQEPHDWQEVTRQFALAKEPQAPALQRFPWRNACMSWASPVRITRVS